MIHGNQAPGQGAPENSGAELARQGLARREQADGDNEERAAGGALVDNLARFVIMGLIARSGVEAILGSMRAGGEEDREGDSSALPSGGRALEAALGLMLEAEEKMPMRTLSPVLARELEAAARKGSREAESALAAMDSLAKGGPRGEGYGPAESLLLENLIRFVMAGTLSGGGVKTILESLDLGDAGISNFSPSIMAATRSR